jgi:hypothetical protein
MLMSVDVDVVNGRAVKEGVNVFGGSAVSCHVTHIIETSIAFFGFRKAILIPVGHA